MNNQWLNRSDMSANDSSYSPAVTHSNLSTAHVQPPMYIREIEVSPIHTAPGMQTGPLTAYNLDRDRLGMRDNNNNSNNTNNGVDCIAAINNSKSCLDTEPFRSSAVSSVRSFRLRESPAISQVTNQMKASDTATYAAVPGALEELITEDLLRTPFIPKTNYDPAERISTTEIQEVDRYVEGLQKCALRLQKERDSYKDITRQLQSQIIDQEERLIIAHAEAARYKGLLELYWAPLAECRINIANHHNDDHVSRLESSLSRWKAERNALETTVKTLTNRVKEQALLLEIKKPNPACVTPEQVKALLSSRDDTIDNLQRRNNDLTKQLMEATN